MTSTGIVLAGGRSSRMGTAKSALEWHGSTLLRRITGLVARVVDGPVVVVRAPGQSLPALGAEVEVVQDPREGLGPLQGLAAGLAATADRAEAAFVCSTDLPFLHPAFIRRVLRALDDGVDVALPVALGHPQPLAAAYRTALAPDVARLVAQGLLGSAWPGPEGCAASTAGHEPRSPRRPPEAAAGAAASGVARPGEEGRAATASATAAQEELT